MVQGKRLVQEQFGSHAQSFVTSKSHAEGRSLNRLVELVKPLPGWRILDVATGGGHTALAFGRYVGKTVATDLTRPMLAAARKFVTSRGAVDIDFCRSDAESMPFANDTFQCVTCRIAPHHFPDVPRFVEEASRVIAPRGILAIADNMTNGEASIGAFINALEKLRDPSHHWAYTEQDWHTFMFAAGLSVTSTEFFEKDIDFDEWAARMGVAGARLTRLRLMILKAPEAPYDWLKPRLTGGRLLFSIREGIVIGQKGGS